MLKLMVVVMGVAGSGKTTLGRELARALSADFWDGDDFHSAHSKAQMRKGQRLNLSDRRRWVNRIQMAARSENGSTVVLACSALSRDTRLTLAQGTVRQEFIWLRGNYQEIYRKLLDREEHYFPAELLGSQFEDLEPPESSLVLQCYEPLSTLVSQSIDYLSEVHRL